MNRKRDSINNLVWGLLGNIITSIIAIVIPHLFIVNYGSEVNGLLSSIRQIYVYLALLEVGIGDAAVVALYGPIVKQDHKAANGILSATNYYYRRIGILYAIAVIGAGLIYPLFLNTTIPFYVCFLVIVLQGAGSVISYLVQGKYNMLLRVDNKNYINTNLSTITTILTDFTRIFLLLHGKSIVAIQTTYLIFNLIKMVYVSWYMKKNYKWIDLTVKPNFKAISKSKSVFVHQISALVFSHTDVLILTFVCGLKTVSIYSLYATIFAMVNNIITITSNSVQSALGQMFHLDKNKYIRLQDTFETYYLCLVFSLFAIATIFILPFMKLYTAGADINYIDWKLVALFVTYQLLNYGRVSSNNIIGFAGAFQETQWRAILETTINLIVSFVCVFKFGIYGVLIGTVIALLYRSNDIIIFANKKVLKRSPWPTYRKWIENCILFIIVVIVFLKLPMNLDNYIMLIMNTIWVSIVIIIIFVGAISIFEKDSRKVAKEYIFEYIDKLRNKITR